MKKLTDEALVRAFVDTLGVPTAASLMGWAILSSIGAPPDADRRWYRAHGFGAQSTRYRRVDEMLRVRQALIDAGYDVGPDLAHGTESRLVLAVAGVGRRYVPKA
jgi:hypothetical protein